MKKVTYTLFFAFYTFGVVILPMGDFSLLQDLPAMYQHCRQTEDPDLTVCEFVTEHLIDIDCLMDEYEADSDDKPHQPYPYRYHSTTEFSYTVYPTFIAYCVVEPRPAPIEAVDKYLPTDYFAEILRPPIG